ALRLSMGGALAKGDRAVDLDGVEPGHAVQAQQVARDDLAATNLHEQIGPARQEASVATEARAELDRLAHRRRLVIVEAHAPHYAPLRPPKRALTMLR